MAMQEREPRTGEAAQASYWRGLYEQERKRLAMLWKAFEDAEARLAELEAGAGERPEPEVVEVVRTQPEGLAPQPRYPVGIYKMGKVPGITPGDLERLRSYGINLTDELLHAELPKLAKATGIEESKLQRWRDISEVMALKGIGPAWAERLVNAGVTTLKDLATLEPPELVELLLRTYEKEGAGEEKLVLLRRTLPARAGKLIKLARQAAKAL